RSDGNDPRSRAPIAVLLTKDRQAKRTRRINVTRHLLMSSLTGGGGAHEPTRTDLLATAASPPSTRRGLGCSPLPAYARRHGMRPRAPRRRYRSHARSLPEDHL